MAKVERILDICDRLFCAAGVMPNMSWDGLNKIKAPKLYAGKLYRNLRQFDTHFGLTPYWPSSRNIHHDVRWPMPISADIIACYQAEDVLEHIQYNLLRSVLDEIYRVLVPGGLFRFSVPDYRFDLYRDRTQRAPNGEFLFDPGGGGRLENGKPVKGAHLWFPTFELVKSLFDTSRFANNGLVNYLQYTMSDGSVRLDPIDYSLGWIQRTPDHDCRAQNPVRPMSIVVDAYKGAAAS